MKDSGKIKLIKNDNVQIIAGKDKGKSGRILKVDRVNKRVIVQGLNMVKKAMKKRSQQDKGGIVDIEAPVHASNVMIVCKKCGPTKIKIDFDADKKVRKCRKCGDVL